MENQKVKIEIYGADVICASCVNAPSSKDTYEWLQAAIGRKYPDQPFDIEYIDIESDIADPKQRSIAEQVRNDEYFYPLVIIEDEVIGEGYIQLKPVFNELEKHGFIPA
ncbi:YuzD family protein [Sporosarcina sp. Marseille-Q4943]|uniref:YuzD family protein n=1 Tax=Sporosarcina sp. Marseille-Q4943 TaxID=2942204 RepID=UPI00208DA89F|nr:YuzD family protein [Sporosarcina sp. Marseille-Q4943]